MRWRTPHGGKGTTPVPGLSKVGGYRPGNLNACVSFGPRFPSGNESGEFGLPNSGRWFYSLVGWRPTSVNPFTSTNNNLIWNAALSRPFLKNRLLAKLSAIDILHKLSNRSITVNAQGRTETWVNSVPNYVMFSVQFKFSAKPKDK